MKNKEHEYGSGQVVVTVEARAVKKPGTLSVLFVRGKKQTKGKSRENMSVMIRSECQIFRQSSRCAEGDDHFVAHHIG